MSSHGPQASQVTPIEQGISALSLENDKSIVDKPKFTLSHLHNDVIQEIIQFLEPKEIARLISINKAFNALSPEAILTLKRLTINNFPYLSFRLPVALQEEAQDLKAAGDIMKSEQGKWNLIISDLANQSIKCQRLKSIREIEARHNNTILPSRQQHFNNVQAVIAAIITHFNNTYSHLKQVKTGNINSINRISDKYTKATLLGLAGACGYMGALYESIDARPADDGESVNNRELALNTAAAFDYGYVVSELMQTNWYTTEQTKAALNYAIQYGSAYSAKALLTNLDNTITVAHLRIFLRDAIRYNQPSIIPIIKSFETRNREIDRDYLYASLTFITTQNKSNGGKLVEAIFESWSDYRPVFPKFFKVMYDAAISRKNHSITTALLTHVDRWTQDQLQLLVTKSIENQSFDILQAVFERYGADERLSAEFKQQTLASLSNIVYLEAANIIRQSLGMPAMFGPVVPPSMKKHKPLNNPFTLRAPEPLPILHQFCGSQGTTRELLNAIIDTVEQSVIDDRVEGVEVTFHREPGLR